MRHNFGPVERTDVFFIGLDNPINHIAGQQAFFLTSNASIAFARKADGDKGRGW